MAEGKFFKTRKMKIIIIINAIIPLLACIQSCRVLIMSYSIDRYLKTRSIHYDLAEEKIGYEKAGRIYIMLVLASNTILLLWNVSRMVNNFAPYATKFITVTSVLFSIILFAKAQLILMLFKNSNLKLFKKLKI